MAHRVARHRGHDLAVTSEADRPIGLTIDGHDIEFSQIAPGVFATLLLPYRNFDSVDALAQAVVDAAPQFAHRRDIDGKESTS